MKMELLFHIPKTNLISTYHKIRELLRGNDAVIFNAMAAVNSSFTPPANPGEYKNRHAAIERIFNFPDALKGRSTAFSLMEEVGKEIQRLGGVVGLSSADLIDAIAFKSSQGATIRLTQELRWAVEWAVSVTDGAMTDRSEVLLEVYDKNWGEVVPAYIVQYLNSGILLYQQGMNAVAVALLSISVEATLRDVLAPKGYVFTRGASSVDVFGYTEADVGANASSYTLTFTRPLPKPPAAFPPVASATPTATIKVKRVINPRDNSVYLKVDAPPWFIDYWSTDTPIQLAQKRVNGLGEAFDIARNREGILTSTTLPIDFDEVITVVRNNLIHLSGDALATPLYTLNPSGAFTLEHFLNKPFMVYDLITNVPRFINEQYVELRRAGHLMP